MIQNNVGNLEEHTEYFKYCNKWREKVYSWKTATPPIPITWDMFKIHFNKARTQIDNNPTGKHDMKINEVEAELATLREANTKFGMALVQQVQKIKQQADDISVLTYQANSAIVTPPVAQPSLSVAATSPAQPTPEMMQQLYAMMQQYPSNGTGNCVGGRGRDCENRNGTGTGTGGRSYRARNDLGNGQRSVRRYSGSNNYCWSCGFDIKHNSENCEYQKEGHNPSATIANQMGGSDANCFHYLMNQS